MRLLLVRHGEAEGNRDGRLMGQSGLRLTPRGHAQADTVAQAIAALDDRYQQGELTEATYREQREAVKARLFRLVWQEEADP